MSDSKFRHINGPGLAVAEPAGSPISLSLVFSLNLALPPTLRAGAAPRPCAVQRAERLGRGPLPIRPSQGGCGGPQGQPGAAGGRARLPPRLVRAHAAAAVGRGHAACAGRGALLDACCAAPGWPLGALRAGMSRLSLRTCRGHFAVAKHTAALTTPSRSVSFRHTSCCPLPCPGRHRRSTLLRHL